MTPLVPDTLDDRDLGPVGAGERRRRTMLVAAVVWYAVLAFVAAVVLASGVVASASVSPRVCQACHGSYRTDLHTGSHRSVACDRCHGAPDLLGLMAQRASVVGMVGAKLVPGTRPAVANIDDRMCLSCHSRDIVSTTLSNGIRMNHRAPLQKRMSCTGCHPDAGHPALAKDRLGYTMDQCLACHNANGRNISTCDSCHATGPQGRRPRGAVTPWRVTHGAKWQQTHGMGDLQSCRSCHNPGYCSSCHDMEVPHPPGFVARHGREIASIPSGRNACYTCHEVRFCDDCHGMPMPHPSGFLKGHAKVAKAAEKGTCGRCHEESSCNECHIGHVHPGLPDSVRRALLSRPVPGAGR